MGLQEFILKSQVAINVLPASVTPKPVVQPSGSWFPKIHRFVHREPAKVVNSRGDISSEFVANEP